MLTIESVSLNLEPKPMESFSTLINSAPVEECPAPRVRRARVLLLLGTISWLLVIVFGLWILWGYENSPGKAGAPPRQWPAVSKIEPARDHPTLVILAHPHCPCTRATIGELASIMAHSQGAPRQIAFRQLPLAKQFSTMPADVCCSAAESQLRAAIMAIVQVKARLCRS